jgi:ATP-dependent RNA helicase RhlE
MPPEIQKLAGTILVNPSKVEVTPASTTAETVQQSIYFVEKKDKRSLLLHVLKDGTIGTALVFTRTKHGADKVAQGLVRAGIRAEAIHGNKSQNARQRALENFKSRHTRILVATDIAARGIDIDDLTHVINYELPNVPETYVHRIGRTGRAGASGTALSFCDQEEGEYLRDIQKLISRSIPVVDDHPHVMHASLSFRPPVAGTSAATGRDGSNNGRRNGGQGNNGRREQSNNERREPSGSGMGRRESGGSNNGRREGGDQRRDAGHGRRDSNQQRRERPVQSINAGDNPMETAEQRLERIERQPEPMAKRRETAAKRPEPITRKPEDKRPDPEVRRSQPEVKRTEPQRAEPQRDKSLPDETKFPFRVNRSEGDEKW